LSVRWRRVQELRNLTVTDRESWGICESGWHTECLRPETARRLLYAIVVVCLALTATFAVFRPPAAALQQGVPVDHVPSASSNAQLRPARIPPLRFQIAVDNGTPLPPPAAPTSYPRACACSHET
jgi:hypothetical protein